MKRIFKRMLCLVIAIGMIGSLLTACGQKNEPAPVTSSNPSTSVATPSASADAAAVDTSERITITIASMGTQFDSWMEQQLEEKYNVNIEIIGLPGWGELNAKVNMLMMDDAERPDVIWWSGLPKEFKQWQEAGILHELTPYFNKYPNIREYYSDMTMFLAANDDGSIWRIPGDVSQPCAQALLVRQDWLDALGLQIPKTTDEFKEMLRAFTEDDPDGNGKNDTYGFTGAGTEWRSWSPFMYPFKADPNNFILKDGKVTHGSIQPEMKEALAFMRECFTAGYIDPTLLTSNNLGEIIAKGKWGSVYRWIDWLNPTSGDRIAFQTETPTGKITAVEPIKHPVTGFGSDDPENPGGWCFFAITTNCKYPERVYAMFDDMAEKSNYSFKRYGKEGVHYEIKDGVFKSLVTPEQNTSENIGLNILDWMVNRKDDALLANTKEANEVFARAEKTSQPMRDMRVVFKVNDRPIWMQYEAEIIKTRDEIFYGIISGQRPLSDFDVYVETFMKQLGGEQIIAEANEYYKVQASQYQSYLSAIGK